MPSGWLRGGVLSKLYTVRFPAIQRDGLLTIDIIKVLDIKVLPYVLFLIVPILGRMSDLDEATRLLSTSTFASLVKMVPLEVSHKVLDRRKLTGRPAYPIHQDSRPSSWPAETKSESS